MRRIKLLLLLSCATVATSGLPAAAAASSHAPGPSTAIVAERHSTSNSGNGEIVSVRPDGSHLRVLTTGNEDEVPDLSPNGRRVVFERCVAAKDCDQEGAKNIYVMNS